MTRTSFLNWALVVLSAMLALGARYGLVEPAHMALICDAGNGPWWCELRVLIIRTFATFGLGYLSIAASVIVLMTRTRLFGLLAAVIGAIGLALYCQEPAAISFILGALVLARTTQPTPSANPQTNTQ